MPQENLKISQVCEEGQILNRAMANGKNDPQYEINLENFDERLDDALLNLQKNNMVMNDPRIQGDHIP